LIVIFILEDLGIEIVEEFTADYAFIQRCSGKEIAARTSHARDIDCRPGDG